MTNDHDWQAEYELMATRASENNNARLQAVEDRRVAQGKLSIHERYLRVLEAIVEIQR